jgi:hypothetical protein
MAQLRPEEHQTPYQEERRGRGRDAADVPLIHSFGPKVPVRFEVWADERAGGVRFRRTAARRCRWYCRSGCGTSRPIPDSRVQYSGKDGVLADLLNVGTLAKATGSVEVSALIKRRAQILEKIRNSRTIVQQEVVVIVADMGYLMLDAKALDPINDL